MQEREQALEVLNELKAYLQRSMWTEIPMCEVATADCKNEVRVDTERSGILSDYVVESARDTAPIAVNDWLQQIDRCDETEEGTVKKWRILEDEVKACVKCRLCETRNNVVFGVGKIKSPGVVFIGEAPGAEEDIRGEPFVGRAGELLTKAISNGMGLQREDVYICNIVKCRPPENRKPQADEVASCLPYLEAQLSLLKPRVVVTLGSVATKTLFPEDKRGITELRGNWLQWKSSKVLPTFHPAYILRNPPAKKPFWEDLQLVMKEIGLSVVERKKV